MKYAIVIEKADSNYSAYVPDLPGCVATGATSEEAEKEIREAIEFHIEGMKEDGKGGAEPGDLYIEIRVRSTLFRKIKDFVKRLFG